MMVGFGVLSFSAVAGCFLPSLSFAYSQFAEMWLGFLPLSVFELAGWGLVIGGLSGTLDQFNQRLPTPPARGDRPPSAREAGIRTPSQENESVPRD